MDGFLTKGFLGLAALVWMSGLGCGNSEASLADIEAADDSEAFVNYEAGRASSDGGSRVAVSPPSILSCIEVSYTPIAFEYLVANGTRSVAQTVTPPATMQVTNVNLPLFTCKSNGLVDAKLTIMGTDSLGRPDPNVQLGNTTVPNSALRDSCVAGDVFEVESFVLNGIRLVAGTKYALVLDAVGSRGDVHWRRSSMPTDPANPYTGGTPYQRSGSSWTPITNLDCAFSVQGTTDCSATAATTLDDGVGSSSGR